MNKNVKDYLDAVEPLSKREDCYALVKIMEEESGYKACLTGKIVGFGSYHYVYESGREGDSSVVAFAPRANEITIYIMPGFADYQKELGELGKHKSSKSCLYVKKLSNINEQTLRAIIKDSVEVMQNRYECSAT
ncbi:MAG: DUF1801 domain-containing protein [Pseudohongiellaceae bacterium]